MESAYLSGLLQQLRASNERIAAVAEEYSALPIGHDRDARDQLRQLNRDRDAVLAAIYDAPIELPTDAAAKLEVIIDLCPWNTIGAIRSVIAYLKN